MPPLEPTWAPPLAAGLLTLSAAATDLRSFRVPNALTIPALAAGVAASLALGGWAGLGWSLLGMLVGFSVLAAFFALGGVGAGDVKLFAAMGAWLGPMSTLEVFAASAFAAGGYALVLALMLDGLGCAYLRVAGLGRRMLAPAEWGRGRDRIDLEARRPDRRRRLVPFAATTSLGFFAWLAYHRFSGAIT